MTDVPSCTSPPETEVIRTCENEYGAENKVKTRKRKKYLIWSELI
jgi:hypothetical protein